MTKGRNALASEQMDADVETLKSRPGEWALVRQGTSSRYSHGWRQRGCQVTVRRRLDPDGTFDIYVRWPVQPKARRK